MSTRDTSLPSVWPFLLVSIAIGSLIDFGKIHTSQNSDSIIPVLVSLYRWTPYYWEQNRFGMLVPLLAIPFKSPYANLLFQTAIAASSGVAAVYLFARLAIRDRAWPVVASVYIASFLLFAPDTYYFMYFSTFQPYNVSLFLGAAALYLIRPDGNARIKTFPLGAAILMMGAAHWVNVAIGLVLAPFVVVMGLADVFILDRLESEETPDASRLVGWVRACHAVGASAGLLLTLSGTAFGWLLQKLARHQTTLPAIASPDQALSRLRQIVLGAWNAMIPATWLYFLAIVAATGAVLTLLIPPARSHSRTAIAAFLSLAMTAAAYAASVAIVFHPLWRYCLPAAMLLGLALLTPLVPLCHLLGETTRPWLAFTSAAGAIAVATALNGLPSLDRAYHCLDRTLGTRTNDLVDARCTHFAGNYWHVWPAVFHANQYYHSQRRPERVWGLTYRSGPTRRLWKLTPISEIRLAIPIDDTEAAAILNFYKFPPLHEIERRRTIRVFIPRIGVM